MKKVYEYTDSHGVKHVAISGDGKLTPEEEERLDSLAFLKTPDEWPAIVQADQAVFVKKRVDNKFPRVGCIRRSHPLDIMESIAYDPKTGLTTTHMIHFRTHEEMIAAGWVID